MTIDDAKDLLRRAKDEYQRQLIAVDSRLRAVVSRDPAMLSACEDVQKDYTFGLCAEPLSVNEAPMPPAADAEVVTEPAAIEEALKDSVPAVTEPPLPEQVG